MVHNPQNDTVHVLEATRVTIIRTLNRRWSRPTTLKFYPNPLQAPFFSLSSTQHFLSLKLSVLSSLSLSRKRSETWINFFSSWLPHSLSLAPSQRLSEHHPDPPGNPTRTERSPVLQPGGPRSLAGLPLRTTLTAAVLVAAQAMIYHLRNPGCRVPIRNQVVPDRGSPSGRSLKRKRGGLEGRQWRALRFTIWCITQRSRLVWLQMDRVSPRSNPDLQVLGQIWQAPRFYCGAHKFVEIYTLECVFWIFCYEGTLFWLYF